MILKTSRFGEIKYETKETIFFENGLVGFQSYQHFLIFEHQKGSPFQWLICLDQPDLAFPIVDPFYYVPDYDPVMSLEEAESLELKEETPRYLFTTATIPNGQPKATTINLAGPIIINAVTQKAKQIVLEDERYSIKHSIFSSSCSDNIKKAA